MGRREIDFNRLIEKIEVKQRSGISLSREEMILYMIHTMVNIGYVDSKLHLRYEEGETPKKIKKILVIQLSSIGDIVYSTPVVSGLRERYPGARISFMVDQELSGLLSDHPLIDEVIGFRRNQYTWEIREKTRPFLDVIADVKRFIRRLENRRFDIVVNLHVTYLSAFLSYFSSSCVRGLSVDSCGRLLAKGNIWSLYKVFVVCNPLMHRLDRLDFPELHIKMADVEPRIRRFVLHVGQQAKEWASEYLSSLGVQAGTLLVGMNPSANYPARQWLEREYAYLANLIITQYNAKVLLFGTKDDTPLNASIKKMAGYGVIDLSGKTDLPQLLSLIERCDFFITGDTGPMHIAAALNTKTLAICGPTRTGPYGTIGHLLVQANLPCVNCGPTSRCEKRDCMKAIDHKFVFEVFRYLKGDLKEPPRRKDVSIYECGDKTRRLFSYYPLRKEEVEIDEVVREIICITSLNLWMLEGKEWQKGDGLIGPDEVCEELKRHFLVSDIRRGIERSREVLQKIRAQYDEGCRLLCEIEKKGDRVLKRRFNDLNMETYKGWARVFNFYDYLFLEGETRSPKRFLDLYMAKLRGCNILIKLVDDCARVLPRLEKTAN